MLTLQESGAVTFDYGNNLREQALQIHGGYGYTKEYNSSCIRDARITGI